VLGFSSSNCFSFFPFSFFNLLEPVPSLHSFNFHFSEQRLRERDEGGGLGDDAGSEELRDRRRLEEQQRWTGSTWRRCSGDVFGLGTAEFMQVRTEGVGDGRK
jgi:hypothetical protein